jgi:hypothetical protein
MKTRHAILLVVVVVGAVIAAPTATGQSAGDADDGYFDALVTSDDDPDGVLSELAADAGRLFIEFSSAANRLQARYLSDVPLVGPESSGNATEYAEAVRLTFNAHDQTLQQYVNARVDADPTHDVFAVYFTDREGGNVTQYVVASVSNDSYRSLVMLTPSEFKAVNRSVDHSVTLDWYVSRHANRELEAFITEYAAPQKDLTTTYKARMITEYGGGLESSLWNDSGGA